MLFCLQMLMLLKMFSYICLQIVRNLKKLTNLMEKIDKLDKQIMEIISSNARIPFKDVASECGVSRAAIHQRVQRLIDLNVIVGSGYHVNPKSLGYTTCTYVGICLEKGSMYKRVVDELRNIPEIVECHYTTGKYDLFIKMYVKGNAELKDVIHDKLLPLGLARTETLISFNEVFRRQMPIPDAD